MGQLEFVQGAVIPPRLSETPDSPPSAGGQSQINVCPNCRTTVIAFDPPVELVRTEACGNTKPGNNKFIQVCLLHKGHDGLHYGVIEIEEYW